ncbi:MAG: hypothetical protein JWP85_2123 [Rhodoglobus sp.]|nr:hypothetical protein [Rhodoglobus sp.]
MTSPPVLVTGRQTPRVRSCPDYRFTSGPDAVAIYESTGRELDLWQKTSLDDHCAERDDGRWLTLESAEEVPRQNGKGEIINALMLLHLFVLGTQTTIYSAHEFKTAKESYLKIYALIRNTPALHKKVEYYHNSNEDTSIKLKTGQRLRFLTRSKDGGRGFTGDVIIFDEAFNLTQSSLAAVLPTLSSRPNPHIYYFSSTGKDTSESDVFRGLKQRGDPTEGAPDRSLIWISYSADPRTADPDSILSRAEANPAYNVRIFDSFIDVERKTLSEVDFMRERLGVWDDSKVAAVINMAQWEAIGDSESTIPLNARVAMAIDTSPGEAFTSISIAGRRADGLTHVEVIDRRRGTGWVVDRVQELNDKWNPAQIVLDAIGPVGALLPDFKVAGVDITVITAVEYAQACMGFVAATEPKVIFDGDGLPVHGPDGKPKTLPAQLVHINQSPLTNAAEVGRKREIRDAGGWGWHRRDSTDISALVSVTLAFFAHTRTNVDAPTNSLMFFGR